MKVRVAGEFEIARPESRLIKSVLLLTSQTLTKRWSQSLPAQLQLHPLCLLPWRFCAPDRRFSLEIHI
jgi:hypothetical protein